MLRNKQECRERQPFAGVAVSGGDNRRKGEVPSLLPPLPAAAAGNMENWKTLDVGETSLPRKFQRDKMQRDYLANHQE
jgi:hypothetical protein